MFAVFYCLAADSGFYPCQGCLLTICYPYLASDDQSGYLAILISHSTTLIVMLNQLTAV